MALRILISADMEGALATAAADGVIPGSPTYRGARDAWTREINAVAGRFSDSGAEVVVADAHDSGSNIELGELDPRVSLVHGRGRKFGMMDGIEANIDAVAFLGYHGSPGSAGVLSHAFLGSGIHELKVNGETAGEGTMNALLAQHFGAPVILVTGDDVAVAEAQQYAPNAETVVVKTALSRSSALTRPASAVLAELSVAAERALRRFSEGSIPASPPPGSVCLDVEFSSPGSALAVSAIPGTECCGTRRILFCHSDIPSWYRAAGAMWTLARASQEQVYG
jgi:D-amino peptidase